MADSADSRTSFAFAHRAALPDHMGNFYRDAGAGRSAFDRARTSNADTDHGKARASDVQVGDRPPALRLADPHPSFALPRRPAEDDGPTQTPRKDDFVRRRLAQEFRARVTRGRDV